MVVGPQLNPHTDGYSQSYIFDVKRDRSGGRPLQTRWCEASYNNNNCYTISFGEAQNKKIRIRKNGPVEADIEIGMVIPTTEFSTFIVDFEYDVSGLEIRVRSAYNPQPLVSWLDSQDQHSIRWVRIVCCCPSDMGGHGGSTHLTIHKLRRLR